MAVARSAKWIVGVVILILLSLVPGTCVDWQVDDRAKVAEAKVAGLIQMAEQFRAERDSALQTAAGALGRVDTLRVVLRGARAEIPAPVPAVRGCEACEARSAAIERTLEVAARVIMTQDTLIEALRIVVAIGEQEIGVLRSGLVEAQQALARLAAPKPVIKRFTLRSLLPTFTAGYGAVGGIENGALSIHHGPGLLIGYKVSF